MGRVVIVGYKPHPGKNDELERLCLEHHRRLLDEGLVTDRRPILMKAENGTVIEVFEWFSDEAMASAHTNVAVAHMWNEYSACSDYVPLNALAEFANLFAEFTPVN